ncbi:hypothetical protein BHQ31_09535 [Burkholderia cenocepacia]|nr:hypothetical protein BHQ31_09535 [Burkholderia cenocepacia]
MKRQMSFAEAESAGKKRVTRRQRFLDEMEKLVPWSRLLTAIEPYYPKGARGRPPIGLERMLRIYFLQQWYTAQLFSLFALANLVIARNRLRSIHGRSPSSV